MKILHIWNTANVPVTLVKYQRMLGLQSDIIMREGATSFGGEKIIDDAIVISGSPMRFTIEILKIAYKYDIIHCHAFPFCDKYIRRLYRWKKFVYHYHGSWIRGQWEEKKNEWKNADYLACVSPDLLVGAPEHTVHMPNPVDTALFTRGKPYKKNTALWIMHIKGHEKAIHLVKSLAKQKGLDLTIFDRTKEPIPYCEFPRYLEQFEYFIDMKLIDSINSARKITVTDCFNTAFSLTGHQALSLGCKVIHDGKTYTDLPLAHDPLRVASQWAKIYRSM